MVNFSATPMSWASTTSIGRLNFLAVLTVFSWSYMISSLLANSPALSPVLACAHTPLASWSERPAQRCLMRNTQPPHLLVSTMRRKGIDQRCTNDAQYSCSGPRRAFTWPRYGGHTTGWVQTLREVRVG